MSLNDTTIGGICQQVSRVLGPALGIDTQKVEAIGKAIEPYGPSIRAFFEKSEAEQIEIMARGVIQAMEKEQIALREQADSDRRAMYKAWNRLNN